jgi:Ca-activated chloride channel family protein
LLSAPAELAPHAAYNLGNARYRQQEFQDAVEAYERALREAPEDRDAKRNLELALRALEQQQQQQQQQDDQQSDPQQEEENQEGQQGQGQQGDEEQEQQPEEQRDEQQQQQDGQDERQAEDDQSGEPQPQQMTAEQAERLLDSLADQEQEDLRRKALEARGAASSGREKDW